MLPEKYKSKIHRSLICKWKQEPDEKYAGNELCADLNNHLDLLQKFSKDESAKKLFQVYLTITSLIINIASYCTGFRKKLKEQKAAVVELVEKVADTIGLNNAIACFQISRSTYYAWFNETKKKCRRSGIKLCLHRFHNQLTASEIAKVKYLLQKPELLHWPVSSIAYFAMRQNIVMLCLSTWYKYAKLLNVNRSRPKFLKNNHHAGIRADFPNKLWHADVTIIRLADGAKAYLYLLMDNYSRCIISWKISLKLSAELRLATIKDALRITEVTEDIKLMVDGGSENNNILVEDFLKNTHLHKIIAQRDIRLSNSMIEAMNKLIKHSYLAGKAFYSIDTLEECLAQAIYDYNTVRPHISLKGLTPYEAQSMEQLPSINYSAILAEARIQRHYSNSRNRCFECI